MIYVFYNNDPLGKDQGGGAEHFRCVYRALSNSDLDHRLIGLNVAGQASPEKNVVYLKCQINILTYIRSLIAWFFKNRRQFTDKDIFHFHRNYLAWPKYWFLGKKGKVIFTCHGLTNKVIQGRIGIFAKPFVLILRFFEKRMLKRVDRIIYVSGRDRDEMIRRHGDWLAAKSCVIPAAFNASGFANSLPPSPALSNKLIIIGRLSEIKNVPLAIAAVNVLRSQGHQFTLSIVGDGEDAAKIRQLVERSPYSSAFTLMGRIESNQIPQLLSEHGILLLTSHSEASPTVVKETLAARRFVVTVDVGDVATWIKSDQCGVICQNTPEAVAQGILHGQLVLQQGRYHSLLEMEDLSEANIMNKLMLEYKKLMS